ncbi:response regulator [bacterium]|nr:response regulator [bacterium]
MKRTEDINSSYHSSGRYRLISLLSGVVFIVLIVIFMTMFYMANRQRIEIQNINYLRDAVQQKVVNFHEKAEDNLTVIKTVAYMYGRAVIRDNKINLSLLQELEDNFCFDFVRFIDSEGIDHTADGSTVDCSDRPYFIDGMKGNSGVAIVVSRINGNIQLGSYAPVSYNGRIIGVMVGFYDKVHMEEMLESKYFGFRPLMVWFGSDGSVFSSFNNSEIGGNLFEFLEKKSVVDADNLNIIREAVKDGREASFIFKDDKGSSCGYIVPLNINGDFLLEAFPSEAAEMLISNTNRTARKFIGVLIAVFAAYIIFIAAFEIKERRKLDISHRRFRIISDATQKILDNFVYIDLRKNTYENFSSSNFTVFDNSGGYADYIESFAGIQSCAEEAEHIRKTLAKANLETALAGSCDSFTLLSHIKRRKESWRTINVVCTERDANGVPVGVLLIMQDTTAWQLEQLRQSQLIKDALKQAESACQAKSVFLSKMSHDIRTPMNGILGMTAIALNHSGDADRVSACLQKINTAGAHLLSLINEVLDMSKIESGSAELGSQSFSLPDLIDNLLTMTNPNLRARGHELKVNIKALRHENVIGDSLKLQQCFTNLMENAIKYTPDGGCIEFSVTEKETDKKGLACYEFVFKDNGLGISEELQKTVFEPFVRGEDSRINKIQGTGLGLSITRNLIRMMGGNIELESEPNKGSTFTVTCYLKIQDEDCDRRFAGKEVLLVSGNGGFFNLLGRILGNMGVKCINFEAGSDKDGAAPSLTAGKGLAALVDYALIKDKPDYADVLKKNIESDLPLVLVVADIFECVDTVNDSAAEAIICGPLFKSKFVRLFEALIGGITVQKPYVAFSDMDLSDKRILLVEDNDLNAEIAVEILEMTGVRIDRAENGEEAVSMVKEAAPGYYDLVFMDIQMPVMNGLEASKAIRALEDGKGAVPIVAMSANAFSDDIKASAEAGMDGHIAKPLDFKALGDALNKWLRR